MAEFEIRFVIEADDLRTAEEQYEVLYSATDCDIVSGEVRELESYGA